MAFDDHANFADSVVAVAPSPALSGTSLSVQTGDGSIYPTPPFNCPVVPPDESPHDSNAEIIRVTGIAGDVLTILRAQEGTTAKAIDVGWRVFNSATDKVFTDIETAITNITTGSIYYVHNQLSANTIWTIAHGLGKFPNVTVVDSGGAQVEGSVVYSDSNTIVITFSAAFGGKAYLT